MKILGEIIVQMSKNKSGQNNQIKLSSEFDEKLKMIKSTLGSDIFELNQELFEILSKNNLT